MHLLLTIPVLLLGSFASAQVTTTASPTTSLTTSTTTSPSTSSPTSLPALVSLLPTCALKCFASAASSISCAPTDITCICASSSALIQTIGPCILLSSGCSSTEISDVQSLAPKICDAAKDNATGSDVSAASSIVSSALATVTGTATASGNAAVRTGGGGVGVGVLGVVGAFAAFAL